jgi:hypothetical protein
MYLEHLCFLEATSTPTDVSVNSKELRMLSITRAELRKIWSTQKKITTSSKMACKNNPVFYTNYSRLCDSRHEVKLQFCKSSVNKIGPGLQLDE